MTLDLGTEAQSFFNSIMTTHGKDYTITRVTETTDSMGTVSSVSETAFTIRGLIQDISHKDRMIHEMGLAVPGNLKFFCEVENDDGDAVKEGDILTDQWSVQWKITNIVKQHYINSTEVFRVCIIKSITTEGST